jgi:hypothetical protein
MPDLKSLEGQLITAIVHVLDPRIAQQVKLHKVEPYGVWLESQKYTNTILSKAGVSSAPRTFVFFVPWSGVVAIFGSEDEVSLSEKGFGLQ